MSYIKREPLLATAREIQGKPFGAPLIVRAIENAPTEDVVEHGNCENKKKATSLPRTIDFQTPIELHESGCVDSISHNGKNVNILNSQMLAGLEWYAKVASRVGHCVLDEKEIKAYLNAFKELTERYSNLDDSYACLKIELELAKANTVRKMQTEIEARCIKGGIYPAFVKSTIAKIAEEMIEGEIK